MSLSLRNICDKCNVRLPKNRPKLLCWCCDKPKHYRCQGLSKNDAHEILSARIGGWICNDCMPEILPVNACIKSPCRGSHNNNNFKAKCHSCNRMCYSKSKVKTCQWCDEICHIRCINDTLGCQRCCEDMIPGQNAHCYELIASPHFNKSNSTFNPYCNHHHTNLIGDQIDHEVENNTLWAEISESLVNCSYKQPKDIQHSDPGELIIFSLNIRSLTKCISTIRDNIADYEKYDVLCFCETNTNIDKLANGMDDLTLEGFHPPIVQKPVRGSCKGGGLATYVNERICQPEDLEIIDVDVGPSDLDGEFLFVKIKKCKTFKNTVIVGNVYRSPSRKHEKFIGLLETALSKLDRHSSKQILIVGDLNTDLIKYDSDIHSQNLIDTTSNRGFVQVISRPTRITDHSSTLLDHIYSNKVENLVASSVLTVDLSDHLATYALVKISCNDNDLVDRSLNLNPGRSAQDKDSNSNTFGHRRIFNAANDEKFKELIDAETWEIPGNLDAENQYNNFLGIYNGHYNTAYPLATERVRRKNERLKPKPWMLPWLENACARKNDLFESYVQGPTPEKKATYDKMKKFTEKHTKLAKDKYHLAYFEQYKDNSKKTMGDDQSTAK